MKKQLRISKISIEIPRMGDEIWVHVTIQEVQWNDELTKIMNVVPRSEYIHRTATDTAMNIIPYFDPVLNHQDNISGYGLHMAVEKMGMTWVQEVMGGEFDEAGKLWL